MEMPGFRANIAVFRFDFLTTLYKKALPKPSKKRVCTYIRPAILMFCLTKQIISVWSPSHELDDHARMDLRQHPVGTQAQQSLQRGTESLKP